MAFKRKKYLIKPGVQLRLALTIFGFIIFYSLLLGFVIFYPLYRELQTAASFAEQVRISELTLYLHRWIWPSLLAVALLAGMHGIFYSHRIVGPLYRFEKMLDELLLGNYSTRIKIRKRDELKEFEGRLNRLADVLEHVEQTDEELHSTVANRLKAASSMLGHGGSADTDRARRIIEEAAVELDPRLRS